MHTPATSLRRLDSTVYMLHEVSSSCAALKRGRESCLPHQIKMRLPNILGNAPANSSIMQLFDLRNSNPSLPLSITTSLRVADHTALRALHSSLTSTATQQSHQQARHHALSRLGHPSVSEGLRGAFQGVQDHPLCRARGRWWQWYVRLVHGLERLSGFRLGRLTCIHSADREALAHLLRARSHRWEPVQHLSPLMDSSDPRRVTRNVGSG